MFSNDYRKIFLSNTPLMDVRAPIEFEQGSFPTAQNIPLLDNEQRHEIGRCYKEKGQDAAIEMGWEFATEEVQQQRLNAWKQFIKQHPQGYLYCFRGGLRSQLSQKMLKEAGCEYPLVTGGYKAMRRFLLDELEAASEAAPIIIIAGPTGSGKTKVIQAVGRSIDLEGQAQHRGSAFGSLGLEQPSQIDFENALSVDWLKLGQEQTVFLEDEGHLIGRLCLPTTLQASMSRAPIAVVDEPLEQRVEWVIEDYVDAAIAENKVTDFSDGIQHSLSRIQKRLGGKRYQEISQSFFEACEALNEDKRKGREKFRIGITLLLRDYYDPMYNYQLQQRQGQEMFRGSCRDVIQWCQQYTASQARP